MATLVIIIGGIIWAWRKAALNGHQEPLMITDSDTFTQDNSLPPRSLLQRPKPAKSATDNRANGDELLPDAMALFQQHGSISTTFLQRLRVGAPGLLIRSRSAV